MASPVGHSAVGVIAFLLLVKSWPRPWIRRAFLLCAMVFLASLPDFDFAVPLLYGEPVGWSRHRALTHSIVFTTVVALCVAAVAARPAVRAVWLPRLAVWRIWAVSLILAISHPLMDLLGEDPVPPFGVMLLWPFSSSYFISSWTPFKAVNHESLAAFIAVDNLLTMASDILLLGPLVALAAYYCHAHR